MAKSSVPDEGFGKLLGLAITEREDGRSLGMIEIGPHHLNPHGVLHGAVMYALADQGMGAAVYTLLAEDESCATIEVKIVYIAPVRDGSVECETRVLNKGRRVAVLESEVRNKGRLVAKALGTFAIFSA
jgi:acyl-CoA thioesterase